MSQIAPIERQLLGNVLAGYPPAELVVAVQPGDFDDPRHESVWRAIRDLSDAGEDTGAVRVLSKMGNEVQRLPGGAAYLHDLMAEASVPTSSPWSASQVRAASRLRGIQAAARKVLGMCELSTALEEVDQLADRARNAMESATMTTARGTMIAFEDILTEVIDVAENGHAAALSTPWSGIDHLTRGLQPGRLVVVGGRPAAGKSVIGMNLAHHVAKVHRRSALVFSIEMANLEVGQRIVANHTSVSLSSLDKADVSERAWATIQANFEEMRSLPIYVEDVAGQTITSIRSAVAALKRKRDDLDLVVVDYLQLVTATDPKRNRAEQVAEMSRGLKLLAREFDLSVVAMAQLNRESTKRPGAKPTLSDLRESGAIEADADVVILLHRPDNPDGSPGMVTEALVEKNRSGPTGSSSLELFGAYARFETANFRPATPYEPPVNPWEQQ